MTLSGAELILSSTPQTHLLEKAVKQRCGNSPQGSDSNYGSSATFVARIERNKHYLWNLLFIAPSRDEGRNKSIEENVAIEGRRLMMIKTLVVLLIWENV